ncbi:MAG: sigma-54-dependent Fis family transcriptional regulator, partial [Burkholderiales bacterium]
MPHALIVEDDANSAAMLAEVVTAEGYSTATAGSLRDARLQLSFRPPDVVLLDLTLPDGSGMDLFDTIDRQDCEIVLITGNASIETSIQALRLGAADYLLKPLNVERLRAVLARAVNAGETRVHLTAQQDRVASEGRFGRLWGRSDAMREIYRQIARVAPTAVTALITGESGTGKEVVAHTIHDLSKRAKAPFLAVNCGAISPQLIESELFGHEKGSFTGAVRQHRGFFERTDGGTLFLDEVTEMPVELQVKLLRVLETGSFTPVGADEPISTDVRIIAATNRAPLKAVAERRLREDLYYRLAVFPIHLPPLRGRREDIPLLAGHFLESLNTREGARKRFSERALRLLQSYGWPGNVRELRNAVHRGFILAEADTIEADNLPFEAPAEEAGPAVSPA